MNELLRVIAEICLELHPERISVIASTVGKIESFEQFAYVRSSFGPNTDKALVERFERAWRNTKNTSPREVASALLGASSAAVMLDFSESSELVWSGPSTGIVPVRLTEEVLCQVIGSAHDRIFLVSFVAYRVKSITEALQNAAKRGVRVDMLLESPIDQGGKVTVDSFKTIRNTVPTANLYVWRARDTEKDIDDPIGSVHAKCAVSDGRLAFITSANLSDAAMQRNMELGILVNGGRLPFDLHRHLEALVTTRIVEAI